MKALLYILGPPAAFLSLVFILYGFSPTLAWMLIGASWYWVYYRFH